MKRLTVLLVAGVMSLSIVACNSTETTTDSVSVASTVEAAEAASTAEAVAESMYDESKQASAMIPDEEDHVPYDITGCDTFTDIVDSLPEGYGYANTTIDDIDVLLVCDYVFDNSDDASGVYAAIDADIYYYSEDGVPTYAGYVTAGGTAYPLAVADGKLYVCGNHFAKVMTIVAGGVVIDEESYVEYDTDGSATYYHHSDLRDVEADEEGRVEDDSYMTEIYDQYMNAEVIVFDQVG